MTTLANNILESFEEYSNEEETEERFIYVVRGGKKIKKKILAKGQKKRIPLHVRKKMSRSRRTSQAAKKVARSPLTKRKRAKSVKRRSTFGLGK